MSIKGKGFLSLVLCFILLLVSAVSLADYFPTFEEGFQNIREKSSPLIEALARDVIPGPDDDTVAENEPKLEMTLREVMDDRTFGVLFPKHILEGYVLEDAPGIFGIDDNIVLKAVFSNDVFDDEMVIRIASKEWFNSHEPESSEPNAVHYRETLAGTGSYIYFEGDEHIISYSFTARDIAQIDGFLNMVNSAEQITVDSVE